jgi:hypothetical protein
MTSGKRTPTLARLRELFDFDPAIGGLIWRVSRGSVTAGHLARQGHGPARALDTRPIDSAKKALESSNINLFEKAVVNGRSSV